ncbi:bifunctional methylenetetrahydrofolate dehydrogenase/methenyltetrahydrofolate cyclohydrolase FolD [Bradyrhizobium sp. CB1015]|nr:bifunctional methylenetetrahydrofolate dehydrogenase/methenyltetrahydrofolate cyclohydrolase FolD [Bradyrhizobium sp. CB1015]
MTAVVIDGKTVSQKIRAECRGRVKGLQETHGVTPCLAVILIGDSHASQVYVRNKMRAAEDVGLLSRPFIFDRDVPVAIVLDLIDRLNQDPDVHGILVQLPLPPQFNIYTVLHRISPAKDVDGFHLYNVGGLVVGDTIFSPCTPFGVMKLLEHQGIEIAGQNVVVVGASNIVGKPMALMMMQQDATVTICHARTRDLAQFTILADILIVAAGVPGLILKQMVRRGAVVIDVGINRLPSGKIVGDVDFEGVSEKASFITPVPGGVGPMTVSMLIWNTITSAERHMTMHPV